MEEDPSSENVAEYVSCITLHGRPLLPPVMTSETREACKRWREEALRVERRLKEAWSERPGAWPEADSSEEEETASVVIDRARRASPVTFHDARTSSAISVDVTSSGSFYRTPSQPRTSSAMSHDVSRDGSASSALLAQFHSDDVIHDENTSSAFKSVIHKLRQTVPRTSVTEDMFSSTQSVDTVVENTTGYAADEDDEEDQFRPRKNSYTLEEPSPLLQAYMEKYGESDMSVCSKSFVESPRRKTPEEIRERLADYLTDLTIMPDLKGARNKRVLSPDSRKIQELQDVSDEATPVPSDEKDNQESIHKDANTGKDNTMKSVHEDTESVQEVAKSVLKEEESVQREGESVLATAASVQKEGESVHEDAKSVQKEEESVQKEVKSVQETVKSVQKEVKSVQEAAKSVQEAFKSVQKDLKTDGAVKVAQIDPHVLTKSVDAKEPDQVQQLNDDDFPDISIASSAKHSVSIRLPPEPEVPQIVDLSNLLRAPSTDVASTTMQIETAVSTLAQQQQKRIQQLLDEQEKERQRLKDMFEDQQKALIAQIMGTIQQEARVSQKKSRCKNLSSTSIFFGPIASIKTQLDLRGSFQGNLNILWKFKISKFQNRFVQVASDVFKQLPFPNLRCYGIFNCFEWFSCLFRSCRDLLAQNGQVSEKCQRVENTHFIIIFPKLGKISKSC